MFGIVENPSDSGEKEIATANVWPWIITEPPMNVENLLKIIDGSDGSFEGR
jgi:hypothetical protein